LVRIQFLVFVLNFSFKAVQTQLIIRIFRVLHTVQSSVFKVLFVVISRSATHLFYHVAVSLSTTFFIFSIGLNRSPLRCVPHRNYNISCPQKIVKGICVIYSYNFLRVDFATIYIRFYVIPLYVGMVIKNCRKDFSSISLQICFNCIYHKYNYSLRSGHAIPPEPSGSADYGCKETKATDSTQSAG